jgi:hypothetical protein
MVNRILRSALIAGSMCFAGIHPASPQIIPNPYPTPTVPPIIGSTPTPPVALLTRPNPQLATAVIQYGQGSTLAPRNDRGRFQKIALQPSEVVTVVMTLSLADVGKPANVQVVDGGAISADVPKPKDILPSPTPTATIAIVPIRAAITTPSPVPTISPSPPPSLSSLLDTGQILSVSQAGQLAFRFVPGADVGLHRVSVIVGGNQYFFQFWRQDTNAPNNNPRMLRAY